MSKVEIRTGHYLWTEKPEYTFRRWALSIHTWDAPTFKKQITEISVLGFQLSWAKDQ